VYIYNVSCFVFLFFNSPFLADCVDEPALDSNDDDRTPSAEETFDTGLFKLYFTLFSTRFTIDILFLAKNAHFFVLKNNISAVLNGLKIAFD